MCNIEKHIDDFHKKYTERKDCKSKRGLKHYYENKDRRSNQWKIFYEKDTDKLLQKQNDTYIHFKKLVRTNIDLENRLKALEEKADNNIPLAD